MIACAALVACDVAADSDTTVQSASITPNADGSSGEVNTTTSPPADSDRDESTGAADTAGSTSASGDETTGEGGPPTFPPTSTGATGPDLPAPAPAQVDVVLSLDASQGTRWALLRLAGQVVAADLALRAEGVDARWAVVAWVDTVAGVGDPAVAVDTLEGWGSDPDAHAAAAAVGWWADHAGGGWQAPPTEGPDEDPDQGAGLDALATIAAWDGWRPTSLRYVVQVAATGLMEPPAAPSGHPAASGYAATAAALTAADVRVLAWAPVGSSGYAAPWPSGDPAIASAWHDLAAEDLPPGDAPSGFAAAVVSDVLAGS